MINTLKKINPYNPIRITWLFDVIALALAPVLFFSSSMPLWAPRVALAGLAILFLLRGLVTGRFIGHTPADWPVLILLVTLITGLWTSIDPGVSLPRAYAITANITLFWVIATQRNKPWLRWTGWILLITGLVLSAIFLLGTNFSFNKIPFIGGEIYDLLPTGGQNLARDPEGFNANLSGGLLALFLAPAVMLIWLGDSWQQRDVAKVVAVVLAVLVVLTQTRGGLLGVAVALPLVTLLYNRRWGIFWLVVLIVIMIGVYHFGPDALLTEPTDAFESTSLQSRQELWERAIYIVQDFPLTGIGLDMFEPVTKLLYPPFLIDQDYTFKHAHNIYLHTAAELGIPGLIAQVSLYLIIIYLLVRQARNQQAGYYRALALGLLGSLIIFLTHGFFEVITFAPRAALVVWGLFGLMIAVATSDPEPVATDRAGG